MRRLRRLRPWQWVRGGILAVLAIVAAVLTVVDPHPAASSNDPTGPDPQGSRSAWTQLPSANDNCTDVLGGPPNNPMRVLVGNGVNADECAGGGMWSPAQQAAVLYPGIASRR